MSGSTATRPTGVTILAVLSAIGGVLGLFWGVTLIGGGGVSGVVDGVRRLVDRVGHGILLLLRAGGPMLGP